MLLALLVGVSIPAAGPEYIVIHAAPHPQDAPVGCAEDGPIPSYGQDDRLVMTYFYYWYDQTSLDDPALVLRPTNNPPMDWRAPAWHARQLRDMSQAGVDVVLPVYWGDSLDWSREGLEHLVQARTSLLHEGQPAPTIALMLDTNFYAHLLPDSPGLADLSAEDGLTFLADEIGDFYDHIPACYVARIDGRPLVLFWRADTEDGDLFTFDDDTFANLSERLTRRLGAAPFFVLEHSWQDSAHDADVPLGVPDLYRWGSALNGPRFEGRTVAVGPGYDDRGIADRPGYVRERDGGATYAADLRLAVLSGAPWLLLETWNELWEGTAIAETEQYGRTDLTITRRYTDLFRRLGDITARDGQVDLGTGLGAYLRRLADAPIEAGTPETQDGRLGARPLAEDDGTGYFHFAVDRRLGLSETQGASIVVEYFDEEDGGFQLEYDAGEDAPDAFSLTEPVSFQGTQRWTSARFDVPDLRLRTRQYGGMGDFRLWDHPGTDGRLHLFGRVTLTALPGQRPVPLEPPSLTTPSQSSMSHAAASIADFHWRGVDGAAAYLLQMAPLSKGTPAYHALSGQDRQRCLGTPMTDVRGDRAFQALAMGTTCRLDLSDLADDAPDGILRWRTIALDATGASIGEPSDWAFLLVSSVTPVPGALGSAPHEPETFTP
ncbi:MAG: DUF5010 domain-containing protein [Chloroflexi bacterium]|nr:DUF5010 domain-containing protein [Chloroflexota bacterium]